MSIEDVHIQCIDEVTVFIAALSWCIGIYLLLSDFFFERLGVVRMWALFMGWWYLFPFLGVHGVGFLVNGPCEKHHA